MSHDGLVTTITAKELAERQKTQGGAVAAALQIVGFVTQNIEDLVARGGGEMGYGAGQTLIARDQNDPDGPLVCSRIVRTYKRTAYALRQLTLRDHDGVEQTQRVTDEHPYHRLGSGWTAARLLRPGDLVLGAHGTLEILANIAEAHAQGITVYNLEVEGTHTYFVRAQGSDAEPVWVHNGNCGGRRGNEATRQHLEEVRDEFLANNPEYRHVAGGRSAVTGLELPEEYIPNPNGGRNGGSYADLTFENATTGERLRVNTVDMYANGTMTVRESTNYSRIYNNTGEPIIVYPKRK